VNLWGEEQVLNFVGDGEFALQSLLLLLLSNQLGQRFSHGIERLFQLRHLVAAGDLDAYVRSPRFTCSVAL
jgi:hypothetical protein